MAWINIRTLLEVTDPLKEVCVRGWIRSRRDSKGFSFLEVNDGSCLSNVQVVVDSGISAYGELQKITTGSSVMVRGSFEKSPGKGQNFEIRADSVEILGGADPGSYPLQKKRHSNEFLRTISHLRPRTNLFASVFRVRSELSQAIHKFYRERDFFCVHTPVITTSDCEGAGQMFRVTTLNLSDLPVKEGRIDWGEDFFGKEAFLTVSGQLEGEALACSLGRVYTFGPIFRSENSNTSRHVSEIWMVEPEMAFYDLQMDMDLAEEFVKYLVSHILEHCSEDMQLFFRFVDRNLERTLRDIVEKNFIRICYADAVKILEKENRHFDFPVSFGSDIQAEHERFLADKHFRCPVIIFDYAREIKSFYMRLNDDEKTVAAMDVIVPRLGEIIGGSQREERYDVLVSRIRESGLRPENYWWYLELRKFGTVPHAGFGLGFDRAMMFLTGIQNIRDVIPFPRTPGNAEF